MAVDPRSPTHENQLVLDSRSLRALAHPLRVRIVGSLREHGPATATLLAGRLGESSGLTSYHLRQLAAAGLVGEEPGRGRGRERWWHAMHRGTWYDTDLVGEDEESQALGQEYLRAVADAHARRVHAWLAARPDTPARWRKGSTLSDWLLRLTPTESARLVEELFEVLQRQRRFDSDEPAPRGARQVVVQLGVLPKVDG